MTTVIRIIRIIRFAHWVANILKGDSCNCGKREGVVACPYPRLEHTRGKKQSVFTKTEERHTYVDTVAGPSFIRITQRRFFFITVRADCIFLRPSATQGVSNLENHVEGGPSNHVFLAIVSRVRPPWLRDPSILDTILPEKEERGRRRDVPSIREP